MICLGVWAVSVVLVIFVVRRSGQLPEPGDVSSWNV